MGVGSNLKKILRERHITIKQVAEETGISANTLYSITKRDSKNVSEGHISAIAKFLKISPADLQKPLLGDYLYNASIKRHLSIKELSSLTNISESKLNCLFNSDHVTITPDEKKALNAVLGIDIDVFTMMGLETYAETAASSLSSEILTAFDRLNETGQHKAIERVQELGRIPEYRKTPEQD